MAVWLRYGLGKEEAESYVLCDAIGSVSEHQWRTEGFRAVGDNEKPLLLQSLWKPREGLARRFEIQRRSSVEEKTSRDKDTITAGRWSVCPAGWGSGRQTHSALSVLHSLLELPQYKCGLLAHCFSSAKHPSHTDQTVF